MKTPKFITKNLSLPYNPKLKSRAKELRKAANLAEVKFWLAVKNKQFLGLDFDRQKVIDNYIVDFYIKRLGIVIEIDGSSHNSKIAEDQFRDEHLKSFGLEVFRYRDLDVLNNLDGVLEDLKNKILVNFVDK